jgi:hypothetical protein
MKIFSYDNHIFDKNIINNLIYTSKNNIKIKDDLYILINFTSYKKHTLHNIIDILYNLSVNEINYNNDIFIPKLNIHKIIINKIDNNISLITNINLQYNNIYDLYDYFIALILNDLNIITNLLINISNSKSYNNIIYLNIKTLHLVSSHILYFDDYIDKLYISLNFINNKNNEKNIHTIDKLNIIKNKITSIKFYYDTLKTSSLQKISYQETNISKVLTFIATIFLPLSFLIGVFSLPIKNFPFRENKNSIYYILFIIIIIAIITTIFLIEFNKKNLFNY